MTKGQITQPLACTAKTKYGRFLKKLEVRVASKLLRILPEFLQDIIFPDFPLILRNPPEF
jgi:hypothetical protein